MRNKIKISDALYLHINEETQEIIFTHDKERDDYSGAIVYFDEIPNLIKNLKKIENENYLNNKKIIKRYNNKLKIIKLKKGQTASINWNGLKRNVKMKNGK